MTDNKILEVSLELQNIDDLFKKPAISPLSSAYQEYSYQAGLEFVADELYADTSHQKVKVTLLLPSDKIEPDIKQKTIEAVKRYCRGRLKYFEHDISATRWRGTRALAVAFIALFVFFGASRLIDHPDNLLRQIISEGLSVAGWVALWFPAEMLSFTLWQHRLDKRIYTMLMNMDVTIKQAD